MNRYSQDFTRRGPEGRQRDAGRGFGGGGGFEGGRGGESRGGGLRGYDRGFADVRGRAPSGRVNQRQRERGRDGFWYANPDRGMTEGFGDFSGRGRYGGYWGATDLRPMMAGYDADLRRGPGRGR